MRQPGVHGHVEVHVRGVRAGLEPNKDESCQYGACLSGCHPVAPYTTPRESPTEGQPGPRPQDPRANPQQVHQNLKALRVTLDRNKACAATCALLLAPFARSGEPRSTLLDLTFGGRRHSLTRRLMERPASHGRRAPKARRRRPRRRPRARAADWEDSPRPSSRWRLGRQGGASGSAAGVPSRVAAPSRVPAPLMRRTCDPVAEDGRSAPSRRRRRPPPAGEGR